MTHTARRVHNSTIRTIDDLSMTMPMGGLPAHQDGQSEIVFKKLLLVGLENRSHRGQTLHLNLEPMGIGK